MKRFRLFLLTLGLMLLLVLPVSAGQIYLPSDSEIADCQTDGLVITYYEENGTLNTDAVPIPIDFLQNILFPALLYGGIALSLYALLRIIKHVRAR